MKGTFKTNKLFFPVLIFCMIVSYFYLKLAGVNELTIMYETIFGERSLTTILLKTIFLMMVLLLQYFNIEYIIYYIDNSEHLVIRYESKAKHLFSLLKGIFWNTALFLILLFVTWFLLEFYFNKNFKLYTLNLNTFITVAKAYLFWMILVLLQILFLINFTKTTTYFILNGIVFGIVIFAPNQIPFKIIKLNFYGLQEAWNSVVFCLIFIFILIFLIKKLNEKRELRNHED